MNKNKCPFCTPAINEYAFAESDNFIAIYNHAPILPGHSLIIPKKHYSSFVEIGEVLRSEMIELSIEAIKMLRKVFHLQAFNWTIQEGIEAGQTIEHLHMHIIPRKEKDLPNPGDWYPYLEKQFIGKIIDSDWRPKYSADQLKKIVEKIKEAAK